MYIFDGREVLLYREEQTHSKFAFKDFLNINMYVYDK